MASAISARVWKTKSGQIFSTNHERFGSLCRGRSMVKTHPEPGMFRTLRIPLFISVLRRHIANPSPTPDLSGPVWVNGRNIFSASPGARPAPLSSTVIRMRSASAYAFNLTSERCAVNLNAFCSKFPTAENSKSRSASTASVGSITETDNRHSWVSASSDAEILTSEIKSATEMSW